MSVRGGGNKDGLKREEGHVHLKGVNVSGQTLKEGGGCQRRWGEGRVGGVVVGK
jgi:hypothetical protein